MNDVHPPRARHIYTVPRLGEGLLSQIECLTFTRPVSAHEHLLLAEHLLLHAFSVQCSNFLCTFFLDELFNSIRLLLCSSRIWKRRIFK